MLHPLHGSPTVKKMAHYPTVVLIQTCFLIALQENVRVKDENEGLRVQLFASRQAAETAETTAARASASADTVNQQLSSLKAQVDTLQRDNKALTAAKLALEQAATRVNLKAKGLESEATLRGKEAEDATSRLAAQSARHAEEVVSLQRQMHEQARGWQRIMLVVAVFLL